MCLPLLVTPQRGRGPGRDQPVLQHVSRSSRGLRRPSRRAPWGIWWPFLCGLQAPASPQVAEGSNPLFGSLCSIQEPFHQEFHTPILRISRWVFGLGFGFFWCFKPYFGFRFSDTQILSLGVFFVAAAMSTLVCSGISVHIPSC